MTSLIEIQAINLLQVATVISLSPIVQGLINRFKGIIESRKGPPILQPYYDITKLLKKEILIPAKSSSLFVLAPLASFSAYVVISLVIPIITPYPLPYGILLDFLGGALMFGFAGIMGIIAAIDAGTHYSLMGASRSITFTAFAEPTLIMVFIAVALITGTNNPYVTNNLLSSSLETYISPTHILVTVAFFMLLLTETGKLPVESSGLMELGMLDDAKIMEYSGKLLALSKWGSYMKQFMLMSVFVNVFILPWGIFGNSGILGAFISVGTLMLKLLFVVTIVVVVEETFSKLRLFKILDFLAISFSLGLLSVVAFSLSR
ncbi:MAG: NADH-quinone oxidoreductase subunit H [Conexivisphaerales archaeon]